MPGSLPSSVGTLYDGDRHASRWTLNDLALHDEERHRLAMEEAEQQDRLCYSAAESGTEESDCEHDHDHEHSHKGIASRNCHETRAARQNRKGASVCRPL